MKKTQQKASLKISQDVVETIAKVAALEVEGVADIVVPAAGYTGIFTGRITKKPIDIVITGGVAEIGLALDLKYGANIGDVCEKVQNNVKENVQTMTGIMVSKVNIAVEGIQLPTPSKKTEEEQQSEENQ